MTSEISRPLIFTALCDGIPSAPKQQILPIGKYSWSAFYFKPSGQGIFTSTLYIFQLRMYQIQYIDGTDTGRVLSAQTMMIDSNGMVVGRAPWYAWDDVAWPADAPVSVLHYPERVEFGHEQDGTPIYHAFSLITHRAPE
jgi:hypothetical protein